MKEISNMHVFICIENDNFVQMFLDALLSKTNLNKDNFIIVIIPIEPGYSFNKVLDVEIIDYNDNLIPDLINAKSLTFISLNNWNSIVLNKIIGHDNDVVSKIHIFVTDDEVERWRKNFDKNTYLKEDKNQHISENVIKALSHKLNFIMPKGYFYDVISKILNHHGNIENASGIFDILFTDQSKKLLQIVNSIPKNHTKILLGSKAGSFGFRATIKIFNSFYKLKMTDRYKFVCLNQGKHKIALILYVFFMKIFKKINIHIEFFPITDALTYNSMVSSISYFILQNRGGGTAARNFVKWGCGYLCIMKDSPNSNVFKGIYKIDLINFEEYDEIANKIKDSHHIDIKQNRIKIMDEESRALEVLSKLYA
tara:strand:- start:7705 stop:8808 length:1104 start_codon:yes stop_codon:yes gene_type:complete